MKVSPERYAELKTAMQNVIDRYTLRSLLLYYRSYGIMSMMWKLFHIVAFDAMNDDEHPSFKTGRLRINPHVPGWEMYPEGINDDHYGTALRKLGVELGLLVKKGDFLVVATPAEPTPATETQEAATELPQSTLA
jgi:hypothetical protein